MGKSKNVAIILFFLNFFIGILYFNNHLFSPDSLIRKSLLKNIIYSKTFTIDSEISKKYPHLSTSYNKKHYVDYLPGYSILGIPFYFLGKQINSIDSGLILFNLLLGSLCVIVFFHISNKFFSIKYSVIISLMFIMVPYLNYYQKTGFTELYILFANLYLYHTILYENDSILKIIVVNIIIFFAFITKYTFILTAIPFYILLFKNKRYKYYIFGAIFGIIFTYWYKFLQFEVTTSFRSPEYFISNYYKYFKSGFWGFLFSPGRSLFFLCPILLIGLYYLLKNIKKLWFPSIIFSLYFFFYAGWIMWYGGVNFGPRFLVLIYPFLILPIGFFFKEKKNKLAIFLFIILFGVSVFINIQSLRINDFKIFYTLQQIEINNNNSAIEHVNSKIYSKIIWNIYYSPVMLYPKLKTNFMYFKDIFLKKGFVTQKIIFISSLLINMICIFLIFKFFQKNKDNPISI